MKSVLLYFLISVVALSLNAQHKDPVDDVAAFLKTSDFRGISKHFSSAVKMDIFSETDVYSKVQAELILKDFFVRYKPANIKIANRLNTNSDYLLGVISFSSRDAAFLAFFSFKNNRKRFLITEIRIEPEN